MKKPDDKLARQLRSSVRALRDQGRRRWLRRRVPLVLIPAVLLGGVALAETGVISQPYWGEPRNPAAARHLALEAKAYAFINKATHHVHAVMPDCKPSLPRERTRTTHRAPSQAILDVLAPLRAPATPADRGAGDLQKRWQRVGYGRGTTYVDYVRGVTAADGSRYTILVVRAAPPIYKPTARCLDAQHARLLELLGNQPKPVRSAALKAFGKMRHGQENNRTISASPRDLIFLYGKNGGGGGIDVKRFRSNGLFGSSGISALPGRKRSDGTPSRHSGSTLAGLVPDGVATVTLEYPRVIPRGRYLKPTVYAQGFTRTVRVRDNLVSLHVPRDAANAFPARMIWRDISGVILRTIRKPA